MDTNIGTVSRAKRGTYRQHSTEFKRRVAEKSLVPGASVSRVARAHDLNANQVFAWRKLFHVGAFDTQSTLLPVVLSDPLQIDTQPAFTSTAVSPGVIILEVGKARLRLEGVVDSGMLALLLDRLLA
ncbi:transposase [Glaciimonas sp. CA11.2]|uniref:IS66-like element accessory protein TnpA n=1 Tax=Glaciimonas sp. CA11.2 TaxID=3048601 RepID=UPI002AB3A66A|nr:transposase [Glaciimonas sp. CA11.2]MDY7548207.1 transposase [Glaciimonas sp. CA11.2]MEB0164361.1 transposase [Glaciimonas sp. CA11.2]